MGLLERKIIPDFEGLQSCIRREKTPERVYFMEFIQSGQVKENISERFGLAEKLNSNDPFYRLKKEIQIQSFLGYEMISVQPEIMPIFKLDLLRDQKENVISTDQHASGPIQSWKDFENYPWPEVSGINLSSLEWLEKNLPENMRCYCSVPIGMYKYLIGLEAMCYMIYDQPDLIAAVLDKIRNIFVDFCHAVAQFSCFGVMWGADDMGFKTQTFLPPDFLKKHILPIHKACAEIAHGAEKFYFLHSCGNLESIMDDIINVVKIDAKHSFEDAIVPITEMKKRYGSNTTLLGGVDVDFLSRADEISLRKRIRKILEICMPGGGYCLGSGNSIADYVPVENYLIMLDEGRNFRC